MKFAGLFVEKVPVDERGNPLPATPPRPAGAAGTPQGGHPGAPAMPVHATPAAPPGAQPLQGAPMHQQHPGQHPGMPGLPGTPMVQVQAGQAPPIAVALRAWVPQEYASHLAPHGVHVIAAGGSVTSEQARGWGADVLVISAECLGQDLHLLQQPQLPTVFISPQPVMIPDVPGVVQAQEPLRASDVAQAAREAAAAFAAARG